VLEFGTSADTAAGYRIMRRHRGHERPVGVFHPERSNAAADLVRPSRTKREKCAVTVRVPAQLALRRQVPLPSAFEREFGSQLRERLSSLTPFRPDEVFWSWRIDRRDQANDLLQVTVCLIPRASLDPGFTALLRAGIAPARIEFGPIGGAAEVIELPHAPGRAGTERSARFALAFCGALAVVALALPFIRQAIRADIVDTAIAALEPRVAEAEALQQRMSGDAAGAEAVAAEEARDGDTLRALATLTDILPDDAHLDKLAIQGRQVTMSGESARAARLIARIAANPSVRDPRFTAPVVRAEGQAAERFVIHAELAP
jgi:general secretion pathway protein L